MWRCETVSCGSSVVIAIGSGLRQDEEFKANLCSMYKISKMTNPNTCNVETEIS